MGRWKSGWRQTGDIGGGKPTWGCMRTETCLGGLGRKGERRLGTEPAALTAKGFCMELGVHSHRPKPRTVCRKRVRGGAGSVASAASARATCTHRKGSLPTLAVGCGSRGPWSTLALESQVHPLMGTVLDTFMAILMTLMLKCFRNHEAHYGNEPKMSPGKMSLAWEHCPAACLPRPQQP